MWTQVIWLASGVSTGVAVLALLSDLLTGFTHCPSCGTGARMSVFTNPNMASMFALWHLNRDR